MGQEVFLCFNNHSADRHKCRKSNDPLQGFVEVAPSQFKYREIRTSNSDSKLVAVGGDNRGNFNKAEVYNRGNWTELEDFPFSGLYWPILFAPVYFRDFFYYIGYDQKKCARLNSESWDWSEVGSLISRRRRHSVIILGDRLMVVGGHTEGQSRMKSESCQLEKEKLSCTQQG